MDPRIRPPAGTREVDSQPHPSRGGNPYKDETRRMVLEYHLQGVDLDSPDINAIRANRKFPSLSTCRRWIELYYLTGDIFPKRASGNNCAVRELKGQPLERLALFRIVCPKATLAECRAHLYNLDPTVAPYSNSQIHRAEKLLGLRRKAASTTADNAYLPINLQRREAYHTQPPPLGIDGVPNADLICYDEAGFFLEAQDRKFGKTVAALRCHQNGAYGQGRKVNLILAISGDNADPMRWHEMWMEGGTTITRCHDFIRRILADLALRHPGRQFVFTMDNLGAHKNPLVLNEITAAGHLYVFRAPYWPVDGAVEYVFNTLHVRLQFYFNRLTTIEALRNRINLIIGMIPSFARYFRHVRQ